MTETYRIRSEATWTRAREDYLSGLTAEAVCRRHDLGLSAFRKRAREGGWRRADQDDPAPSLSDLEIYDDLEVDEQVHLARLRFNEALSRGRVMEAVRWRSLWLELSRSRAARDAELFPDETPLQVQERLKAIEVEQAAILALAAPARGTMPPPTGAIVHQVHSKKSTAPFVLASPGKQVADAVPLSRRERRLQARDARQRSG